VPVKDVAALFENSSSFLDTHTFEGASHGDLFMDDDMRAQTLDKILDVMKAARETRQCQTLALSSRLILADFRSFPYNRIPRKCSLSHYNFC
jgi:hypothetical protein